MIDVHCHLLPGVDDGPADLAAALALVKASTSNGIRQAICTPHIYPGRWDNGYANLQPALDLLRQAMAAANLALDIKLGAEVRVCDELPQLIQAGRIPMLGHVNGYDILLLEMPDHQIPAGLWQLIPWLMRHRVRPLIAHPERNKAVMADPGQACRLHRAGCWLQVTTGALLGSFGSRAQATAEQLLEEDLVYLVATDSHNLKARQPNMAQAHQWLSRRFDSGYADMLTTEHPGLLYHSTPASIPTREDTP